MRMSTKAAVALCLVASAGVLAGAAPAQRLAQTDKAETTLAPKHRAAGRKPLFVFAAAAAIAAIGEITVAEAIAGGAAAAYEGSIAVGSGAIAVGGYAVELAQAAPTWLLVTGGGIAGVTGDELYRDFKGYHSPTGTQFDYEYTNCAASFESAKCTTDGYHKTGAENSKQSAAGDHGRCLLVWESHYECAKAIGVINEEGSEEGGHRARRESTDGAAAAAAAVVPWSTLETFLVNGALAKLQTAPKAAVVDALLEVAELLKHELGGVLVNTVTGERGDQISPAVLRAAFEELDVDELLTAVEPGLAALAVHVQANGANALLSFVTARAGHAIW